jgi:hypothetical protein
MDDVVKRGDGDPTGDGDGLAIAALITGGIGVVVGLAASTYDFWIPLGAGVAGAVLGWLGRSRGQGGMATGGLALGVISLAIGIYSAIDLNRDEGPPFYESEEEPEPRSETLQGTLNEPLRLRASELSLSVTAERVIDPVSPDEYSEPERGTRLVGVEWRIENLSDRPFEEGSLSPSLITKDGREAEDAFLTSRGCSDSSVPSSPIPAGEIRRFCVPYAVDESAQLDRAQVTLEDPSAYPSEEAIGVWSLDRR